MGFNLSDWWMRQRIGAQVRNAGGRVEHSRIANPYHAVSIEAGLKCCSAARTQDGLRHLSSAAPMLPLKGCTQSGCQCRYMHHNDRRTMRDRRVNFTNPHGHKMADRRESGGRRIND